jgi:dTDP-4-amino-4,6-dideoxygalactose transaminase
VLLQKLPHLETWNRQRRAAAAVYLEALAGVGDLDLPQALTESSHVWHLFVVQTGLRDELAEHLRSRGVHTGCHYPQPAHLSGAYAWLGYGVGSFPVTESLAGRVLSLKMFPGITDAQLEYVAASVKSFFDDAGKG